MCHRLNQRLGRDLLHCYTVMYLTPAHTQAVPVHTDDQDVIILQTHGHKRWRVYLPPAGHLLPLTDEMLGKGDGDGNQGRCAHCNVSSQDKKQQTSTLVLMSE